MTGAARPAAGRRCSLGCWKTGAAIQHPTKGLIRTHCLFHPTPAEAAQVDDWVEQRDPIMWAMREWAKRMGLR